jgi:ElaB/YqjD/DUF883 family membrane-anchored ribosome-binding protein
MNTRNGNGTTPTTGNFDDRVEALKDSVRGLADLGTETVSAIKGRAMEVKDEAVTGAQSLLARTAKMIKQNPIAAVGIAFGIGYIAMRLFRR